MKVNRQSKKIFRNIRRYGPKYSTIYFNIIITYLKYFVLFTWSYQQPSRLHSIVIV